MAFSHTIAVVFDFDDTLVPDSTTMLLQKHGISTDDFWSKDLKKLVAKEGYDTTLGWMKLLLDQVGEGKPLGVMTNAKLKEFGATLDSLFHPGLPQVFDDLKDLVSRYTGMSIEFYIVSGGLQPVIEGSTIVQKYFKDRVYGCLLGESGNPPQVSHVKRAITFTEKTRFLFEINKGLTPKDTQKNPYLVNTEIPKSKRHVPFRNMIYVGDGLTDIPCFSLLKRSEGICFGVFDPSNETKAKRAFLDFLKPGRVISMHSPKYGPGDDLGSLLRVAVGSICNRMILADRTVIDEEEQEDD